MAQNLRRRRLSELITADSKALVKRHGIEEEIPAELTGDPVLALVDGRALTLGELDLLLGTIDRRLVERRAMALAQLRELEARGLVPEWPCQERYRWELFRRIWERFVTSQAEAGASTGCVSSTTSRRRSLGPEIERWTFDLLFFDATASTEALFAAFRARYEHPPGSNLAALQERLESFGIVSASRRFEHVTSSEAAGLGPEIHTTIKKRLRPGAISRPLHVTDHDQVVVIQLHDRVAEEQASAELARRISERRLRRETEACLANQILNQAGFLIPSSHS